MYCNQCGAYVDDNEKNCPTCGTEVLSSAPEKEDVEATNEEVVKEASSTTPPIPVAVPAKLPKAPTIRNTAQVALSIIGIVAGALSVVFSFVMLGYDAGYGASDSAYGGDAYTGIQNAAASTSRNIVHTSEIIRFGLFALLFVIGIIVICYFAKDLVVQMQVDAKKEVDTPIDRDKADNTLPEL